MIKYKNIPAIILFLVSVFILFNCEGDSDSQSENITGLWLSAGDNLSAQQAGIVDSIKVYYYHTGEFKMFTYMAEVPAVIHEGIYVVTQPSFGLYQWLELIYDDGRVEEGLFQYILGDQVTMETDIVQTVPDVGHIPPDPERGIGSSSLGAANIQIYEKLQE